MYKFYFEKKELYQFEQQDLLISVFAYHIEEAKRKISELGIENLEFYILTKIEEVAE